MSNDNSFVIPAGKYWIGDPCYAFPNDGAKAELWYELIAAYFDSPTHFQSSLLGVEIWAGPTDCGDGTYIGSDGKSYSVDSGLIGIMTQNTVDYLENNDENWLNKVGKFVTYDHPVRINLNPTFKFDNLIIDTGPDDFDDSNSDYANED